MPSSACPSAALRDFLPRAPRSAGTSPRAVARGVRASSPRRCTRSSCTRHPVDAGTALVLLHSLQRLHHVVALDDAAPSAPRRFPSAPFPRAAVGASPLRRFVGASPLLPSGSSARADFWRLVPSRLTVGLLSPTFGPSPRGVSAAPSTTASADSSRRCFASPFRTQGEVSPGKNVALHRAIAGSTPSTPWPRELRGYLAARPVDVAWHPVLVHRPAASLPASFPRSVALAQLRFALLAVASLREDFHLRGSAHAGRTKRRGPAKREAPLEPTVGIEPTTYGLRNRCSAI